MNKKYILASALAALTLISATGCNEAKRVRENLAQEADNFNCYRQITVINCITGDTMFCMKGRCSITADRTDNQLEVIVEEDEGKFKKHIIGLSDNVTYVVEDIDVPDVSKYQYELNFNPNMWVPAKPVNID